MRFIDLTHSNSILNLQILLFQKIELKLTTLIILKLILKITIVLITQWQRSTYENRY